MIQEVHLFKSKVQFSFWAVSKNAYMIYLASAHGVSSQCNLDTFGMHTLFLHFNDLKVICIFNIFDRWTLTRICHNKYVPAKAKQAAMLDFNCTLLFSIHTNTLILLVCLVSSTYIQYAHKALTLDWSEVHMSFEYVWSLIDHHVDCSQKRLISYMPQHVCPSTSRASKLDSSCILLSPTSS